MAAGAIPLPLQELPGLSSYASLTNPPELLSEAYAAFSGSGLTAYASLERPYSYKTQVAGYSTGLWSTGENRDYLTGYIYYASGAQLPVQPISASVSAVPPTFVRLNSELDRISKLEENWDGEGADKPTEKTLCSAQKLIHLALQIASKFIETKYPFDSIQSRFLPPQSLVRLPGAIAGSQKYDYRATGLLTFDKSPMAISCGFAEEDKLGRLNPSLYPTVDGGVALKLFSRGKELKCTTMDETIEVIRWQSAESYESDGLWDLDIEQTREHFEWLMNPSK